MFTLRSMLMLMFRMAVLQCIPFGIGFSYHINGRIGATGNTIFPKQDEVLDKLCG